MIGFAEQFDSSIVLHVPITHADCYRLYSKYLGGKESSFGFRTSREAAIASHQYISKQATTHSFCVFHALQFVTNYGINLQHATFVRALFLISMLFYP